MQPLNKWFPMVAIGILVLILILLAPLPTLGADEDLAPRSRYGKTRFYYRDADYEQVYVAGTFSDWVRVPMHLDRDDGIWTIRLEVSAGRHAYQFMVVDRDETWTVIDPGNSKARRDEERGWVSKLRVYDDDDDHERKRRRRKTKHRNYALIKGELERDQPGCMFVSYQRVDGWSLGLAVDHVAGGGFEPSARVHFGYGFSSKKTSVGFTVLQPLLPNNLLWLKFSGYDRTDYARRTGIGDLENTLATVFFREDYRDYFRRRGITASAVVHPVPWLRLEGGMHADDFKSLENATSWSLKNGEFLPNPPVDEGTLRSLFGEAQIGGPFNHIAARYERSGEDVMGGGFEFEQITARVRGRIRLGPRQKLDIRVAGGTGLGGEVPAQRRYVLGGLGTVRGYGYQSLLILDPDAPVDPDGSEPYGGQTMVLGNAEYTFTVLDFMDMVLFYDAGMAWEEQRVVPGWNDLKSSAGIGFQLGEEGLRVNLIQTLDEMDRDVICQLRLNRMF